MFCSNCGKKLIETAAFCSYCGSKTVVAQKEENNRRSDGENRSYVDVGLRDQDKIYVLIAHLGAILLTFFAPLIIFLLKKDKPQDDWVRQNAANSLNFQITWGVALLALLIVPATLIQIYIQSGNGIFEIARRQESTEPLIALIIFAVIVAVLVDFILCIVASVKSISSAVYQYPLAFDFLSYFSKKVANKNQQKFSDESKNIHEKNFSEVPQTNQEDSGKTTIHPDSGNQIASAAIGDKTSQTAKPLPFKKILSISIPAFIVLFGVIFFAKNTLHSKSPHYVVLDAYFKNDIYNAQIMEKMYRASTRADYVEANGLDRMYNFYEPPYESKEKAIEVARSLNDILRNNNIRDIRFVVSRNKPIGDQDKDFTLIYPK